MPVVFSSIDDYVNRVVLPTLGDYSEDFDVKGLAQAMTEWHDEKDEKGNVIVTKSGLIEREDVAFWEVAPRFDLEEDVDPDTDPGYIY